MAIFVSLSNNENENDGLDKMLGFLGQDMAL